jgi:ornithine carbamoyltransferase
MTAKEKFGKIDGLKLAYIGDGNNVARSLAGGCGRLGLSFIVAAPKGYQLEDDFINSLHKQAPNLDFKQVTDPSEAVNGADIVYTDTWISMGQEQEKQQRIEAFKGFQITKELMAKAHSNAIFMHCLPAYREYEVSDEVMESEQSVVFQEAENRLHFQRTLLSVLIADGGTI